MSVTYTFKLVTYIPSNDTDIHHLSYLYYNEDEDYDNPDSEEEDAYDYFCSVDKKPIRIDSDIPRTGEKKPIYLVYHFHDNYMDYLTYYFDYDEAITHYHSLCESQKENGFFTDNPCIIVNNIKNDNYMRNTIYHLINYHQNKKYSGKTHRITDKDIISPYITEKANDINIGDNVTIQYDYGGRYIFQKMYYIW